MTDTEKVKADRLERSYKCFCLEQAIEALKQYEAVSGDKEVVPMRIKLSRKLEAL